MLANSYIVAWMDKSTHLPSDLKPESYFENHLGLALAGAKTALSNLDNYKEMRALAISIGLLLTVSVSFVIVLCDWLPPLTM